MTSEEAKKIIGRTHDVFLKNMHKALSAPIGRWLNSEEDERRLEAACKVLRKKYTPRA